MTLIQRYFSKNFKAVFVKFLLSKVLFWCLHTMGISNGDLLGIQPKAEKRASYRSPGVNLISKISIFWVNIIGRLGGDFNAEKNKKQEEPSPPNHSHIHQLVACCTQQETYPLDMAHLSMQRPPNDLMRAKLHRGTQL